MKPPKINKLSKKELQKAYIIQWHSNNLLSGENARLESMLDVATGNNEYLRKEDEYKSRLLKSLIQS